MKEKLEYVKNITLLYVEDDKDTREELTYFLEKKVDKLFIAKDGEEGYELYKKEKPDLVITDLQMPKLNGIEMIKLIKDFDNQARVIILTAFNDMDYLFEAIQLGIDCYKTKPIDIKDLFESIAKFAKNILLEKENKEIQNVLKQYKDVVDERSIVSKTDKNGIITYANKPFENISGYTKDELIGNTHSLVKHEETSNEIFEDMWKTIQNKKVWSGVIKNRKKNGDYYIVDTLIKPILDMDNEIIEFIALRMDITDLETSRAYFEKQTRKTISNLKESVQKVEQYEDAIDKSNIIIRLNKDKKIVYVNESFCKVSGYSQEELIGQNYSFIKDPNINEKSYFEFIDNLENTLNAGKIWKGKVSNSTKDGGLFHCNLTVYPLKDKYGNINEYLGIRHDITEIEKLHTELELTQREIIYKLGEVGETRSKETGNHVKRVAEYSKILASKIGLDEQDVNTLFTASPMHDIGKVGIPDSILHKPGKLTPDEWEVMRSHSEIGYNILKDSSRKILKAAAIVSYTHHEKWNGKGYPLGLKGEEIHIYGRITALADVLML